MNANSEESNGVQPGGEYPHGRSCRRVCNGKQRLFYDGRRHVLPAGENTEYLSIGYVSDSVASADSTFDPPPKIDVVLEAGYTCYGLQLNLGSVAPQEVVVRTFYNGETVDVYTVVTPDLNAVLDVSPSSYISLHAMINRIFKRRLNGQFRTQVF